jgi:hypothetical protein
MYNHWIAIGEATVNIPIPGRPVPKPINYEPPAFAACIANLRAHPPLPPPTTQQTTAQLKAICKKTYEGIQSRILKFVIAGYWLRNEATEQGVSVSDAEVRTVFEKEKRAHYPTAASFRQLQEASRQTAPDLMFAVETQMLSAKLLRRFTKSQPRGQSEQATIAVFNTSIRRKWAARTNCAPGYVVRDCRQYPP